MTTETEPVTTHTTVPVTCNCGADMVFTVERFDGDSRRWTLHCTECGSVEEMQDQKRHHLWLNDNTVYVGSYWYPDRDPVVLDGATF